MDDYFQIPALSASGINRWYESPYHFWQSSPFNPLHVEIEQTDAMKLGTLAHLLLLEPEKYASTYAVAPQVDKRTKEGKAIYAEFEAENAGKIVIKPDVADKAFAMQKAIFAHTGAANLIRGGEVEKPIFWHDESLPCKAKPDCIREVDGACLVVDYKTGGNIKWNDLSTFIYNRGYHRQAAWYMDGVEKVTGRRPDGFALIVQDVDLPELIAMPLVSAEFIELGQHENHKAVADIKERLASGDWIPFPRGMFALDAPEWAARRMNNEMYKGVI